MEKIAKRYSRVRYEPSSLLGYPVSEEYPMICFQISNSDFNQAILGTTYYCMGSIYNVEELTEATQMHLYHIN
jgi:hypothetical protein